MTEKLDQEHTELLIYKIVSDAYDRLYECLDELHKRNIGDTEVITALRKGGYRDLAEGYIDWSGAVDPTWAGDDNTTMNPVVPDPGDAPSYKPLATELSITEELTAAGINADNLERALVAAVSGDRIESGIFYADRSNNGTDWHIYRKRNYNDNGAFIGTYPSREVAINILRILAAGQ